MIINSILDNDLYAFTTMNAIARTFPNAFGKMELMFRQNYKFTESMLADLKYEIATMAELKLKPNEKSYIRNNCYYLDETFLMLLNGYRFDPSEITISLSAEGELRLSIYGPLFKIVLWEVPLMALISQVYFTHIGQITNEKEIISFTEAKSEFLRNIGIHFSDFGTRRRESFLAQKTVVKELSKNPLFNGTSNVYLAMTLGLNAIGTFPHLWVMANGAIHGYKEANYHAFENWVKVYNGSLGIALTDTYTTDVCFNQMSLKQAKLFDGLRQDSGDPVSFLYSAIDFYEQKRIDPSSKTIVFSDSLGKGKIIEISKSYNDCTSRNKPKIVFGIGTWFSNGFGHKHLNMVIKLKEIENYNGFYKCVKLSDEKGKESGDPEEIALCKNILGIK